LKLSGPPVPAGSAGMRGLVRETFLPAEMASSRPILHENSLSKQRFRSAQDIAIRDLDVFDIKESFPI
jgi:hypothetical protein